MFYHAPPHPTHSHRPTRLLELRRWVAYGICGALLIAAMPYLWEVWVINHAGVSVNRAVAAGTASESEPKATPQGDREKARAADLAETMMRMELLAGLVPQTAAREMPIWRTYAAAARMAPSDRAFELLWESWQRGRLDRVGELWLVEVAGTTGRWEEAEELYTRVDAANMLIHRAEMSLQAGDQELAVRQFMLAKKSLDATHRRAAAAALLSGGETPSLTANLAQSPGEQITALYEIARGLSTAGRPGLAVQVFEEALEAAKADPPGAELEQSIVLGLGLALARTLPESEEPSAASAETRSNGDRATHGYFALDQDEYRAVKTLIRIRTLAHQGLDLNRTAPAYLQAGRILVLIGDSRQARIYLEEAIKLDPLLAEAYLLLGRSYEERGLIIEARRLYEAGAQALPANGRLAGAHAILSYQTMPVATALPILENAAELEGADMFVFAYLADAYVDLEMLAEARSALHRGLLRFPGAEPLLERLLSLPRPLQERP